MAGSQNGARRTHSVITRLLGTLLLLVLYSTPARADHIAVVDMEMMILPGTSAYLTESIDRGVAEGAKLIIVRLNTPGGMLNTTQEMIQEIFQSPIPIVIYVSPSGGTATSAGVFLTLAGHVAAMAPGTSIGAAHPVGGGGEDLQQDMRAKAENMAIAMVKSISEQRGRNVMWAERAVKESASVTEKEALSMGVIDLVAGDIEELLRLIEGRQVTVQGQRVVLPPLKDLPRVTYSVSLKQRAVNVLANPNVAALLWLGASTGLAVELYNPGLIFPGVVGVICLILALAVSQIIPLNSAGIALLIVGGLMIGAELYVSSGLLGIGGIIAILIGAMYLVDLDRAPDLSVAMELFTPLAITLGIVMLALIARLREVQKRKPITGYQGLEGRVGRAMASVDGHDGRVFVNGEIWSAVSATGDTISKDTAVEVVKASGSVLTVRPVSRNDGSGA